MKRLKRLAALALLLALLMPVLAKAGTITVNAADYPVTKDGWYSTMEEVAVYIATYHGLPGNYITKNQATNLGWSSSAGNLWRVAKGKSIGGDRYGNYEGLLPDKKGRTWKKCDIDYQGGYRGGKRIVFSSDWLIYYTGDHYASFDQVQVISATPTPRVTATPRPTATPAPTEATFFIFETAAPTAAPIQVEEDELYYTRDEVAAYIHEFWALPMNYITKAEARELGWVSSQDNLGEVAEGFVIGGDVFQNREGLLPATDTRTWYECDVNTLDGKRSQERLVFSSDGLIYYTNDGFKSFEQLY